MYLARGLTFGETHPDEDEFINVEKIPLDKLIKQVMAGEIPDGKTQTALLKAYYYLHGAGNA
jgi:ADP-ribose pyrophosphatase